MKASEAQYITNQIHLKNILEKIQYSANNGYYECFWNLDNLKEDTHNSIFNTITEILKSMGYEVSLLKSYKNLGPTLRISW
jgi:hypothetical protein